MPVSYPFDPTGFAPTNTLTNEMHSVQPPADIQRSNYIVPRLAPFFSQTLEVWTGPNKTGTKLIEGVDYFLALKAVSVSIYLNKSLYGGIVFTNTNYTGNVYCWYNTLGGDFTINSDAIIEQISTLLNKDVRFLTWDQIEGIPSGFPTNVHTHHENDWVTMEDVANSIYDLAQAILLSGSSSGGGNPGSALEALQLAFNSHITRPTGAHTPGAVGLGNVQNYGLAIEVDVNNLASNKYMTPYTVQYQIDRTFGNIGYNDVVTNVSQIQTQIVSLQTSMSNISNQFVGIAEEFEAISNQVASIALGLTNLTVQVQQVNDTAINAVSIANAALMIATSTDNNFQQAFEQLQNAVYIRQGIYTDGTHNLIIPNGTNIRVTLIGAGGGSGAYFDTLETVKQVGHPTTGSDSVFYYNGTRFNAVDPIPLLVAEAGHGGSNGFLTTDPILGGRAGKSYRYGAATLRVSDLVNIDISTNLQLGDIGTFGTNGVAGDAYQTEAIAPGVGGWGVNASGNSYSRRFGAGMVGSTRAGRGGSGAKISNILRNDSGQPIYITLVIGKAGRNCYSSNSTMEDNFKNTLDSMGAAIIEFVN